MSQLSGHGVQEDAGPAEWEAECAALGDVLSPAHGTHGSQPVTTDVDRLRATIVTEESRHGEWSRLTQYGPLPKRIALGLASSWRRAKPELFGGDRHFLARIVPVASDNFSRHTMTVRSKTLYAIEVFYPHPTNQKSSSSKDAARGTPTDIHARDLDT